MIDTIHSIQTPEGVELDLRAAGPVARSLAWLVDAALRVGVVMGVAATLGVLGRFGAGLNLIALFAVWWFFPVFFEVYWSGQTPGKKAMGLRVVHENGTPVGWAGSILRNFLRVVDFLPSFYAVGLSSMCLDRSFRRLGDLAAGTLVVYTEPTRGLVSAVPDAVPLAPSFPLHPDEQRAIVAFAERGRFLTGERAEELARIAEPLVGVDDPRGRLERVAAFLVGRRGSRA